MFIFSQIANVLDINFHSEIYCLQANLQDFAYAQGLVHFCACLCVCITFVRTDRAAHFARHWPFQHLGLYISYKLVYAANTLFSFQSASLIVRVKSAYEYNKNLNSKMVIMLAFYCSNFHRIHIYAICAFPRFDHEQLSWFYIHVTNIGLLQASSEKCIDIYIYILYIYIYMFCAVKTIC